MGPAPKLQSDLWEGRVGVWGGGLYSDDFALDLRSTISAVSRLPFDDEALVDLLAESEPTAASNPADEYYTTFWLVVAHQFAKRGIRSDRVRENALAIIDSAADVALREKLGASSSDVRKRQKMLAEIRALITAGVPKPAPRSVLRKPQPLLMQVGDVFAYPTFDGRCRNPYFASKGNDRLGTATPSWTCDSWAAVVIVDCGRAFGFLSWYRPLKILTATVHKPTLDDVRRVPLWRLAQAGTCSAAHFKRMEFQKIGTLLIDEGKLREFYPDMRPGTSQAVQDISIANSLHVGRPGASDEVGVRADRRKPSAVIALDAILRPSVPSVE